MKKIKLFETATLIKMELPTPGCRKQFSRTILPSTPEYPTFPRRPGKSPTECKHMERERRRMERGPSFVWTDEHSVGMNKVGPKDTNRPVIVKLTLDDPDMADWLKNKFQASKGEQFEADYSTH